MRLGRVHWKKTKNAAQALLIWFIATATMSAVVSAGFVWEGNLNPIALICVIVLVAVVFGYFARGEYRWYNSVDGIGPDIPPS